MGKEIGAVEVTAGRELIVYDAEEDFETVQIELQVVKTIDEASALEEEYHHKIHEASRLTINLNETPKFKILVQRINEIQLSIQELMTPPGQRTGPQSAKEKADAARAEAMQREAEKEVEAEADVPDYIKNPSEKTFLSEKYDAKVKSLFRKLNAKCHPDKTKDMYLHEVFKEVLEAYRLKDLKQLETLSETVGRYIKSKKSVRFRKKTLKQRLSDAKARLRVAKHQMEASNQQVGFVLLQLKEQGRDEDMEIVYEQFLDAVLHQLRMRKASLTTGARIKQSFWQNATSAFTYGTTSTTPF